MTNEQIDKYEELSKAVDIAHENLSDAIFRLCAVQKLHDESVYSFSSRIEEACNNVQLYRRYLMEAQGKKRAFVMSF
jgi:hypothetical protein